MTTERPQRILLLEDEDALRGSMVRGLAKMPGVMVMDVATVREGKAILAQTPSPDLVISDLDLPDGLGIEIATEVGRLGLRVPIVFVSAYVGKFKHRLPEQGDFEVYEKPLPLQVLRTVVEDKLGRTDRSTGSPFGVADYIQLAAMGRHSVVIEVASAVGRARIFIKRGDVWSADDRLGNGIEALRRLVFLGAAQVTCRTLDKDELPTRNIQGSAESVLLDVMRQHDEHGRSSPQPPVDDGWGDVFGEPGGRAPSRPPVAFGRPTARGSAFPPPSQRAPSPAPISPRPAPAPPTPARTFDEAFERGVDALLVKDYARAMSAFQEAHVLKPEDARVRANLARLKAMGFA